MDVTRRYVRDQNKHAAPRNRAPEAVLLHIMDEIRAVRRKDMSKQDKFRLNGEDLRESKELRSYVISSIANDICRLKPQDIINGTAPQESNKALEGRMSGNQAWIRARNEQGRGQSNQQDPRNQHPH
jgi:peptide-N4-(N-acetyl-beta-glucosaminyl)asparagine amidase